MAPRDDRATRGRLRGVVSILLTATIGLAGCGDQAASAPTANPANCSQDVSACNPGDIGAGGGTVFLVVGDGAQRIIVEYAQAGWSGTGEDPQLEFVGTAVQACRHRLTDSGQQRVVFVAQCGLQFR